MSKRKKGNGWSSNKKGTGNAKTNKTATQPEVEKEEIPAEDIRSSLVYNKYTKKEIDKAIDEKRLTSSQVYYCHCDFIGITHWMVGCDHCQKWLHDGECMELYATVTMEEVESIKKFYCAKCITEEGFKIKYMSRSELTKKLEAEEKRLMNEMTSVKIKQEPEDGSEDEEDHPDRTPRCTVCINCHSLSDCGQCFYCLKKTGRCRRVICYVDPADKSDDECTDVTIQNKKRAPKKKRVRRAPAQQLNAPRRNGAKTKAMPKGEGKKRGRKQMDGEEPTASILAKREANDGVKKPRRAETPGKPIDLTMSAVENKVIKMEEIEIQENQETHEIAQVNHDNGNSPMEIIDLPDIIANVARPMVDEAVQARIEPKVAPKEPKVEVVEEEEEEESNNDLINGALGFLAAQAQAVDFQRQQLELLEQQKRMEIERKKEERKLKRQETIRRKKEQNDKEGYAAMMNQVLNQRGQSLLGLNPTPIPLPHINSIGLDTRALDALNETLMSLQSPQLAPTNAPFNPDALRAVYGTLLQGTVATPAPVLPGVATSNIFSQLSFNPFMSLPYSTPMSSPQLTSLSAMPAAYANMANPSNLFNLQLMQSMPFARSSLTMTPTPNPSPAENSPVSVTDFNFPVMPGTNFPPR